MKGLRLISTTLLAGLAGCSLSLFRGSSEATGTDTDDIARPIVQVREFPHSALVSVVAWDANEAAFGLRTSVSRTGRLVGGVRFGDHLLYMVPSYASRMGGFKYAAVTEGHLLLTGGSAARPQRDLYACFYGNECSPMYTIGVAVPDSVLRANQDSLVVTFYPSLLDAWTITLRREVIAPYLNKVDSVMAELKKTASM